MKALLDELHGHSASRKILHEFGHIDQTAGEPVYAVYDKGVALAAVLECALQLRPLSVFPLACPRTIYRWGSQTAAW
jgi:hypothetical protein